MAIILIEDQEVKFPYMYVVVSYITVKYLFEQYVNMRQMRLFTIRELPEELSRLLDISQKQFKRSQKFYYDKLAFEMYTKSIRTAFDIIIILCRAMPFVWNESVNFFNLDPKSEFQRGLVYLLIEALRQKLIEVPNNFYNTHVIERRYHLTQMSFALQFSDLVIETGLSVVVYPLFLYGYLYTVEVGGDYLFIYVFDSNIQVQIFMMMIVILYSLIYPNYIQPLFNDFKELQQGELRDKISELMQKENQIVESIYIMDGSKRSDHSNAYFFGLFTTRIVFYDTLVNKLSNEEILSVVAHELGHRKLWHPAVNQLFFCLKIMFTFYLFGYFKNSDQIFLSFGFQDKSIFIGSALFFALFEPINSVFQQIELYISRQFEFQADSYACKLYLGQHLKSGLVKSFKQNSQNLFVDSLYQWYYNSHPTLFERLEYLNRKSE